LSGDRSAATRYSDGARSAVFFSELLVTTPVAVAIQRRFIKAWDLPSADEPMDDADRQRIVSNVGRALNWAGYGFRVLD
jgi:hypothetical protein